MCTEARFPRKELEIDESRSFYNRYYQSSYGTQSATWLFNQVKTIAAANSAITVSQFAHSFSQPSIIAKIPGTSSNIGTWERSPPRRNIKTDKP